MNNHNSTIYKIWRILYPLLLYFLMNVVIVWAVQALASLPQADSGVSFIAQNSQTLASVIFLCIAVPVFYTIFKRDYNPYSSRLVRKPGCIAVLVLLGALASHGLSALVSLLGVDRLLGNYDDVQNAVFAASPVFVVLQTVILAPLSEEILFRGIIYKRLEGYFKGFWLPAVISSAIFGAYHLNLAQGLFAFLFGLLACAVYDQVKNLWGSVAVHAGGNLLAVILVYAGADYAEPAIYIPVMAGCLAASWALYYFVVRKWKKHAEQTMG